MEEGEAGRIVAVRVPLAHLLQFYPLDLCSEVSTAAVVVVVEGDAPRVGGA